MVLLLSCVCRCLCSWFYGIVCVGWVLNRLCVVGMNGGSCLVCRCSVWLLVGRVNVFMWLCVILNSSVGLCLGVNRLMVSMLVGNRLCLKCRLKCCMLLLCEYRKVVRLSRRWCSGNSRVWLDLILYLNLMCVLKWFGGW